MRRNQKILIPFLLLICTLTACSDILEKDISDDTPEILGPNESVIEYGTISFWWNKLDGATSYRLQLVSPSFNAPQRLVLDTLVNSNIFEFTPDVGVYQWRVQAVNYGYSSLFSPNADLEIIEGSDLGRVTLQLQSPSDNHFTNNSSTSFSWSEISIATGYRFQLFSNEGVVVDDTVTQGFYSVTFADDDKLYEWVVTAFNETSKTVSAKRKLTIDHTSPPVPGLTVPRNDSTLEMSTKVNFTWIRSGVDVAADSFYIFAEDGQFIEKLVAQKVSGTSMEVNISSALFTTDGDYFWQVKSIDMAGNTGPGAERSFTVFEP
jgi:hypothetical protein